MFLAKKVFIVKYHYRYIDFLLQGSKILTTIQIYTEVQKRPFIHVTVSSTNDDRFV